jgi:hypothetical protein
VVAAGAGSELGFLASLQIEVCSLLEQVNGKASKIGHS